ncbi:hypothetical protein PoMZ_00758 [Pyricularia oryzae]|uniref:Uncharacterized protein n=1 Tax=Pyricularia oryzae TaxID=318829 RepID=A0A4P7N2Z9_PYROR|nr:hypothetical protein PoMZ_00758 [Pyricularia oryzae]
MFCAREVQQHLLHGIDAVALAPLHELAVRTPLDDPAALDHQYEIGLLHRVQAVGDGDDGDAAGDPLEPLLQGGLALGVEGGRALVQQQQPGPADEGARDGQPLALAAAQPAAVGPALGVVAAGQRPDDGVVQVGQAAGLLDLGVGGLAARPRPQPHVEAHRAVEQRAVLRHHGHLVARERRPPRRAAHVHAVHRDAARARRVQALHQREDRGLACARRAHQPHELARRHGEAGAVEDGHVGPRRVGKRHVAEGDGHAAVLAVGRQQRRRRWGLGLGGRLDVLLLLLLAGSALVGEGKVAIGSQVDQAEDPRGGGPGARDLGGQGKGVAPEVRAHQEGDVDGEELALGVLAPHDELGPPPVDQAVDEEAGAAGDREPDVGVQAGLEHIPPRALERAAIRPNQLLLQRQAGHRLHRVDRLDRDADGAGVGLFVLLVEARECAELHDARGQEDRHDREADQRKLPGQNVGQNDGEQKVDQDRQQGAHDGAAEPLQGGAVFGDDGEQRGRRASLGLVPLHRLAHQRPQGQDLGLVENVLGHDAEAKPAADVCHQLDKGKHENQATKQLSKPQNTFRGGDAGIEKSKGVSDEETRSAECATHDDGTDDAHDEPPDARPNKPANPPDDL